MSPHAPVPYRGLTRLTPLLVFGMLALVTALVWRQQVLHDRTLIRSRTRDVSVQAARRLQIMVGSTLAAASMFARRWSTHEKRDFSQRRFKESATVLVDEVPGIKAWYHHDTRVRVVEPVEQELTGVAILGSGATPEEGVVGVLVYVGQELLKPLVERVVEPVVRPFR